MGIKENQQRGVSDEREIGTKKIAEGLIGALKYPQAGIACSRSVKGATPHLP